jgi:hypothetical protein
MTLEEQTAIDQWFTACQQAQPPGTLALLVYVRDGQVFLGREDCQVEMKDFPLADLPQVADLIGNALDNAYPGVAVP